MRQVFGYLLLQAAADISGEVRAFDTDNEFIRGAQIGMQIGLNGMEDASKALEDYSCEKAQPTGKLETYASMVKNLKNVFKMASSPADHNQRGGVFDRIEQVINIMAIYDENYDGGKFCQGLLFAIESMKLALSFTSSTAPKPDNYKAPKSVFKKEQ